MYETKRHFGIAGFAILACTVSQVVLGCAGGEDRYAKGGADTTASSATATAPGSAAVNPAVAPTPSTNTAAPTDARLVALGDSIFHGRAAGGTCQTCHGPDAKGTTLAPNLTDSQWLNGDGSYQFIVNTVTSGVPKPKQYPAPMPPMGGGQLNADQIRAVAAYVSSLSRPAK